MKRAEVAADIDHTIKTYRKALLHLKGSVFSFYIGDVPFSEVKPGFELPEETWQKLRSEITSAIESKIKELKQQFKEL